MLLKRVIPSILFSNDGLYKTVKYKNKKYVGDPINTIRLFNDLKVDELILLDIDATKSGKGPNFNLIKEIASECFMPLCYGGGISSIDQAENIFSLGVEKICLNARAFFDLKLVTSLSEIYGCQSIVVSIDVKRNFFGKSQLFSYSGKATPKYTVEGFAKKVAEAGAGEIFLTSVEREGSMNGFDLSLISHISTAVDIPIIAHGGGGDLSHILSAFEQGASAVSCGSKFIYQGPHKAVLINYLTEEEHQVINPVL